MHLPAQSVVVTCPTGLAIQVFISKLYEDFECSIFYLPKLLFYNIKKIQINISYQAELIWFCVALLDSAISEVWHLNKNSVLYVGHQLPSTDYFHIYYLISDSHNSSVEQALPLPSFHRCLIREMENIGNTPRASELVRAMLVFHPIWLGFPLLPLSTTPLTPHKWYNATAILATRVISGRPHASSHLEGLSVLHPFSIAIQNGHGSKNWDSTQQQVLNHLKDDDRAWEVGWREVSPAHTLVLPAMIHASKATL